VGFLSCHLSFAVKLWGFLSSIHCLEECTSFGAEPGGGCCLRVSFAAHNAIGGRESQISRIESGYKDWAKISGQSHDIRTEPEY